MEVELKLLVDPKNTDALRKHPLLEKYAVSAPHEQDLSGTYFDTTDLRIRRCDAGLRVRQVNQDWVQTLKAGGHVENGLHTRNEWESRVGGPEPDLAALRRMVEPKSAWGKMLRSLQDKNALKPLFTTHVKRTVWELRLPQGDEVECVLDEGDLEGKNTKVPICEMELELKSGDPAHLYEFALALQKDVPMQIGNLSKADRGYALVSPTQPEAVKAAPLTLSKSMTVEQAFQAIVGNCMAQIQANEPGVAEGQSVESLHQMRVGLRRLRSALGLFREVLQPSQEMQDELAWLVSQLGDARDWDVLAGSTLSVVAEAVPEEARISAVKLVARAKAQEKHKVAANAVTSPRYTALVLSFSRWVQSCGWREGMPDDGVKRLKQPVKAFARQMLAQDQQRLLKRGSRLKGASPEARHRVRIAAKKARYATEFFQSLYPAKKVKPYVTALSGLQDTLGWLNDASVGTRLLEDLQEGQPEMAASVGFVRGYLAASVQGEDRALLKQWKKFEPVRLPR